MTTKDLRDAHQYSRRNREAVKSSSVCGCFYSTSVFSPGDVSEWTDESSTALCPRCGIDAVIPSASGLVIEAGFLNEMHQYWFSHIKRMES